MKDESGDTPIIIAVVEEAEGTAALLIEKGVAINARDAEGRTAYSYAAETGNLKLKKMLLWPGANPRVDGCWRLKGKAEINWQAVLPKACC